MSLLGAVAYLSHTRVDVAVFICALQRHTHKPLNMHARRLNQLLTWIQRNPRKLEYDRFGGNGGSTFADTEPAPPEEPLSTLEELTTIPDECESVGSYL